MIDQHRPVGATRAVRRLRQRAAAAYWNPFINGLFTINGQKLDGLPAWPVFETLVGLILVAGAIYYARRRSAAAPSRSRPTPRPARRVIGVARDRRTPSPAGLRGELCDDWSGRMQRVPELAGRELTLTALSGGITNRNFLVDAAGTDERWVIRLAGNDTHLLGISREVEHAATVAAAGVGVGPEVTAFIRPEGYLVTRFIVGVAGVGRGRPRPETLRRVADSLRRIHDGPAIPGLFVPLRIVEAYRALALARGVPHPARVRPGGGDRPADRAGLPGRPDRAAAVPQRPAQRQLHRRRHADPDRRLGVRRDGRPVLRPRQLQHQPRADGGRGRDAAGGVRRRRSGPTGSPG